MLTNQKGLSIVELLVTIGLAAILFPALLTGFVAARGGRAQQEQRIQATALVEEAQEAVRQVRESGWEAFVTTVCPCHPKISGSSWILAAGAETTADGFTRSLTIEDVLRDADGNIVTSGGTDDPSTKKVTTTLSWGNPIPSSITSIQYLTRNTNEGYVETTEAQFNNGTYGPSIEITNTSGGEVILGPGGAADWCNPSNNLVSEMNLPKQGVALAISAEVGRVFIGTGENSSGVSLADVNTSDPANPILSGTANGYKTNGVFVEGDFGYVATDTNSKEIVVVDLTSDQEVGFFNAPGNGDGISVYAANNIGYVTVENKLYNFDLSSKNGSRPILDSDGVTLDGVGNRVVVVGQFAYVAIGNLSNQLNIIDISNPNNITLVGRATVDGKAAKDVSINSSGTRAYLVTANSDSQKEFFIIDITTKGGNSHPTLGSFDTGGLNPTGLTVIETDKRAIIVGDQWSGKEYQVLKLEDETNPSQCAGLNFNFGINGVSSVLQDGTAYSFIVTPDAGKELKVIAGGSGSGGGLYASSGVFQSQTFDAGKEVIFNSFSVTTDLPAPTNIEFAVAVKDGISGSCSGVIFSSGDFIPLPPGALPLGTSGQCLRYKAILSTSGDFSQTPTLYDITFNYSL
ncbi:hypothetical protein HYT18_05310 [Candidatus Microgenomates bacterium]|nr:hypothetical protein [Candidatus Microgenomates bacterium]